MAESAEHQFLSQCTTEVLGRLSRTNLYAYVEAERRKFDFACELRRDWSRPLVGQTLWNHTAGVDKDVRTMLLDAEADICAYVARDTIKTRRLLSEALHDFRSGSNLARPHRLRVFWVPEDFDADDESQCHLVTDLLTEQISRDILMNIVFGNLTAEDVRFFVRTSGLVGLHIALLFFISTATEEYSRVRDLAEKLEVSPGAIRERLIRLSGCGFLRQFGGGATLAGVTLKGRVFLDFCGVLRCEVSSENISAELLHLMRLLDMRYAPSALNFAKESLHLAGPLLTEVPEMVTGRLVSTVAAAEERWGVDLKNIPHVIYEDKDWGLAGDALARQFREESRRYSS
ncbi:hypothetical protein ACLVWQ_28565 [Streptomyces sp. CWNU-52B]|uniref:hypothetical protein n=1 Tax=unclassified Streptomyces TaxID=2593676 RepID=UPI0039C2F80F